MIYTVIVLEKLEEKNTWPDFGHTSFMGYYMTFDNAEEAVRRNAGDIHEACYDFAVIEEVPEGVYSVPRKRWYFRYKDDGYVPIDEPPFMKYISNLL